MSAVTKFGKILETNDIVEQTYYLEQKIYEYTKTVNSNKAKISKSMGKRNNLNIKVDNDTEFFVTKNVKPEIEFFPEQLKKNLDKETYKKVSNKTVYVNDLKGLIKMLKSYGVSPKEFKKFISTSEEISKEEISRLIDIDEIGVEDILGCYDVKFNEEIRVKKLNR